MSSRLLVATFFATLLSLPISAKGADAGDDGGDQEAGAPDGSTEDDGGGDSGDDGGSAADATFGDAAVDGGTSAGVTPVACGGALCDTTNGATAGGSCSVASGSFGRTAPNFAVLCGVMLLFAFLGARRSRRAKVIAGASLTAILMSAPDALAEESPPVDVVLRLPPPPRRRLLVEWNPLPAVTIGKWSANVVFAPVDHHALILAPFYASVTTNPINVYDDQGTQTTLPLQTFESYGGEIGYRYYFGQAGPRGFFLGPSLILAAVNAAAQNGAKTHFANYGIAADIGYQMLVADTVAVSLGGGLQYTTPSQSVPAQQFPAEIFANAGVRPRLLLSIGWALW